MFNILFFICQYVICLSQKWVACVKYMDQVISWCPVSKFNLEGYLRHRSTTVREVMRRLFGTFVLPMPFGLEAVSESTYHISLLELIFSSANSSREWSFGKCHQNGNLGLIFFFVLKETF